MYVRSHLSCIEVEVLLVKSGYPPQSLTIVPELPLSSLGLRQGEQIIVSQKASARGPSSMSKPMSSAPAPSIGSTARSTGNSSFAPADSNPSPTPSKPSGKPDTVRTEGGFLVHRVSIIYKYLNIR